MTTETDTMFSRAKGYVIRAHELGMGLIIAGLCAVVAFLCAAVVVIHPDSLRAKKNTAYQLGHDVGVFCDVDPKGCSVICVNNLEQDYLVAECTRGIYNGYNSKTDFSVWKDAEGQTGEQVLPD